MTAPPALRILFAGTPEFAVPPLRALLEAGHPPLAVLTQPDRPAGRGRALQACPVKQAAQAAGIPVLQPTSLRDAAVRDRLGSLAPDLIIVAAYGLILPPEILALPRYGCWNIHASLLPRWRGAAPIQRAIEAGDEETGVCIMQMDAGLDTGPLLLCRPVGLDGSETAGSLHDRLSELGAGALLECLRRLAAGTPLPATPQAARGASYAPKLSKDEGALDWSEPARALERKIRAFNPWPVAWCRIGDERVRVWRAGALPDAGDAPPGTVLAAGRDGIDVATTSGALRLLELQPPGGRRMTASDYLNARRLPTRLVSRAS